jgi:hypothetical protein
MRIIENGDSDLIMNWFNRDIGDGENGILIHPDLPTFRQIYGEYVKEEYDAAARLEDTNNDDNGNRCKLPRIILVAAFYETTASVKHYLSAIGVDTQRFIDNGSLIIVDTFNSYYPDMAGMKKLVASLSMRATKEGRAGVTVIVNMGFFFLFGGDGETTRLISYEASLPVKVLGSEEEEGCNVRGFSCYNIGDYNTLTDDQKMQLAQRQKKILRAG